MTACGSRTGQPCFGTVAGQSSGRSVSTVTGTPSASAAGSRPSSTESVGLSAGQVQHHEPARCPAVTGRASRPAPPPAPCRRQPAPQVPDDAAGAGRLAGHPVQAVLLGVGQGGGDGVHQVLALVAARHPHHLVVRPGTQRQVSFAVVGVLEPDPRRHRPGGVEQAVDRRQGRRVADQVQPAGRRIGEREGTALHGRLDGVSGPSRRGPTRGAAVVQGEHQVEAPAVRVRIDEGVRPLVGAARVVEPQPDPHGGVYAAGAQQVTPSTSSRW